MNEPNIDARKRFVEAYALKLVDHTDITAEILKMMNSRREKWPWVEEWVTKDAPLWTNTEDTVGVAPVVVADGFNRSHGGVIRVVGHRSTNR